MVRKASPSPEKRGKKKSRRDDDSDESEESGKRKVSNATAIKATAETYQKELFSTDVL